VPLDEFRKLSEMTEEVATDHAWRAKRHIEDGNWQMLRQAAAFATHMKHTQVHSGTQTEGVTIDMNRNGAPTTSTSGLTRVDVGGVAWNKTMVAQRQRGRGEGVLGGCLIIGVIVAVVLAIIFSTGRAGC
jgi:hypothetical protein